MDLEIAGFHFAVRSKERLLIDSPEPIYKSFFRIPSDDRPTIPVSLELRNFPDTKKLLKTFDSGDAWEMFRDGDAHMISHRPSEPDGPLWLVRFDLRFEDIQVYCGKVFLTDVGDSLKLSNPFTYPLDQLLLMYVLAYREGALVHSAVVNLKERAYMFSGRSGAGKSTLSGQFRSLGYEVLSDDRVAVRKMENGFRAFGTPWSGEADIALNKGLPLGGIFFISHGTDNVITELTPAGAAGRLMPVTSIPFYDKETMLNILSFCEDLVLHVPAYELCFKPGIEVVDLLEEFISRQ